MHYLFNLNRGSSYIPPPFPASFTSQSQGAEESGGGAQHYALNIYIIRQARIMTNLFNIMWVLRLEAIRDRQL